jgi:hypothetical protein
MIGEEMHTLTQDAVLPEAKRTYEQTNPDGTATKIIEYIEEE